MRTISIPKPVLFPAGPDGQRTEYTFRQWCEDWIYGAPDSSTEDGIALCEALDAQFDAETEPTELHILPSLWDFGKKSAKAAIEKRRDAGQLNVRIIPKLYRFLDVWNKAENAPDA